MSGRVALVTGGAQGIGAGIAEMLGSRGFRVAVADLNADGAAEVADRIGDDGGSATAVALDVTDGDSVRAAIAAVEEAFGPVEVLVNNVGWDDLMPFVQTDEAFWDRIIDLNLKGALRTTHAVVPGMIERRWGRVVNIGSDAGRVGSSLEAVYSSAKGGVIAFTKTLAREVATKGITANVVCPGPTDTPAVQRVIAESPDGDAVLRAMTGAVPMKRMGQPADIGAAVAYFASDEAGFVTGQTLSVSGGLTMA